MKQKRKNKKVVNENQKVQNIILTILFFVGIILTILEIEIYRKTLINWVLPTSIWIITGVVALRYTKKYLVNYYSTTGLFLQLVYNIAGIGGIVVFIFMGLNRYLLIEQEERVVNTKILRTGKLAKGRGSCEVPYVEVHINEIDKQLMFPCDSDLSGYNTIELKLKKGLFGFDVITSQNLQK